MSRRAATPMRSAHSTASPYEAMATSQHAHIDDLVQRNRTLEHTIKKLNDELAREQSCSKDTVRQIQARWHADCLEWREGCDTLQACNRIIQLRTAIELDKERLVVAKEAGITRQERLAKLQRDYKITMFRVREIVLEARVAELDDEVLELREHAKQKTEEMTEKYQGVMKRLKERCANLAEEIVSRADEMAASEKEKETLEAKHSRLQEQYAQLRAAADSTTSELERMTIELDRAQTANAELDRLNDDLKRDNVEIKRQLDKWQNLETKDGVELDAMRKRRIELEVNVKELESRLSDAEEKEEADARVLENHKRKIEKLNDALTEWRQGAADAEEKAEKLQEEASAAQKAASKVQKQLERLKAELEVERARAKPVTPEKISPIPAPSEEEVVLAIQQSSSPGMRLEKARPETKRAQKSTKNVASANGEKELKPHSKLRPRPNPAYKGRKDARNKDEEEPKAGPSRASRAKATATQQSDIEEGVSVMTMKTKGNGKGRARAEEEENDVEIVEAPTKSWAKRKTSAREDSDLEAEETLQKKVRRKGAHRDVQAAVRDEATNESSDEAPRRSQVRASKPEHEYGVGVRVKRTKAVPSPSGSAQSRRMVISENEDEDGPATKKKKRKINIFGPAQEPTFAWGQMAQGDKDLGIPTILSPVKETDAVPSRSNSSILGRMGSVLAGSFRR